MTTELEVLRSQVCTEVRDLKGGWCELSRRTGLDRSMLNRAFAMKGHTPSLTTVLRVLPHLGLRMTIIST
jgi:DNA-binding phage protein